MCVCGCYVCVIITDSLPDTVQPTSPTVSAISDLDMMNDQANRGDEIALDTRYHSESDLRLGQLENKLHSIKTMLDMLKKQVH